MIAYNHHTLDNLDIQAEAATALRKECIDKATHDNIVQAYPVDFYTPNPVIRIGLFILTAVIILFSLGLAMLLNLDDHEHAFTVIFILGGFACYGALELFIREKKCYHAGIDDALLWGALLLFGCAAGFETNYSAGTYCLMALALLLLATLRFADMPSAAGAFLAFLAWAFTILVKLGATGRIITPFVIMLLSLLVYNGARILIKKHTCRHYKNCLMMLEVVALLTLYLAGNYFVVREISNEMFDLGLQPGQGIPGGWIFWILTVAIPPVYLWLGIRRKDVILLRTGLILLAAIVFTVRYYHSVMPLEVAMVAGGIVLTGGAWLLIRYLHTPQHGFTYQETADQVMADRLKIESLVIAQTFTPGGQIPGSNVEFGGGTGGGGGASGEY